MFKYQQTFIKKPKATWVSFGAQVKKSLKVLKNKKSSPLFTLPPFFVCSESDIILSDDKVSDSLLAAKNNWG